MSDKNGLSVCLLVVVGGKFNIFFTYVAVTDRALKDYKVF